MSFFDRLKTKASELKSKIIDTAKDVKEKVDIAKEKVEETIQEIKKRVKIEEVILHHHRTARDVHINHWVCICDKCAEEKDASIEVTAEHAQKIQAYKEAFAETREELNNGRYAWLNKKKVNTPK